MEYSKYLKLVDEYSTGIKSITSSTYTKGLRYIDGTRRFNTYRSTSKLIFDEDGVLTSLYEHHYANKNELVKGVLSTYTYVNFNQPVIILKYNLLNKKFFREFQLSYNADDKIQLEKVMYYAERVTRVVQLGETYHTYFENTHLINNSQWINPQLDEEKIKIVTDESERILEYKSLNYKGKVHIWYKNKYNDDGLLILSENMQTNSSTLFFYRSGKIYSREVYDLSTGTQWKRSFMYNEKGDVIKEVATRNNELYEVKIRKIEYYE